MTQHAHHDTAAGPAPSPGTAHLSVDGGRIAYGVTGRGPLVVLAHGMGHRRTAYRSLTPHLVAAGYRVASADLRGCGESTAVWPSYTRTDIAGDLLALIRHLGGPATLVGHSISGGAATIAAAQAPDLITGIVEIAPFTRAQAMQLGHFRSRSYRRGAYRMAGAMLGSVAQWLGYLDLAYPGRKPDDWAARQAGLEANLREPGRMKALQAMLRTSPADAGAQLAGVRCPALIIEGTLDPDWPDPRAEGEAVVAALPAGLGELAMVDAAGHYPHDQDPDRPAGWLRIEAFAVAVTAVVVFAATGEPWWLIAALFLVPDLSWFAYLAGPRTGAWVYNLMHSARLPLALLIAGAGWDNTALTVAGAVGLLHIGVDRMRYGLKYDHSFAVTHLGVHGPRRG